MQDFERPCRDCDISEFAKLCDPWELIGHHLGLDQSQLNAIKEDYRPTQLRRIKMLQKWKETRLRPLYSNLIEALLQCGMVEQALSIGHKLKADQNRPWRPAIAAAELDNPGKAAMRSGSSHIHSAMIENLGAEYQMRSHIRESLRALDRQFAGVQIQLTKSAGVTLGELKLCISTLPSFQSKQPTPLLQSNDVNEFFHVLKDYCNALCPDILEDLVEVLGDEDTKRKWIDFNQEHKVFQQKTKLKDLIGNFTGPVTMPLDYEELEMKLGENWHEKTLEDLENLRYRMSLRAWILKMINDGSVIVVYFVPRIDYYSQLNDFGDYLRSQNVLQISICIFKSEGKALKINPIVTKVLYLPKINI